MCDFIVALLRGAVTVFGLFMLLLFIAYAINPNLDRVVAILCSLLAGAIHVFSTIKTEERKKEKEDSNE